jgi:hypothetical protein
LLLFLFFDGRRRTFFPIHPTLERLWVRSKLAGTFANETWDGWSAYGRGCSGHWPGDDLAVGAYLVDLRENISTEAGEGDEQEDEDTTSPLRVGELYEFLSTMGELLSSVPYVYDTFEWSHCAQLGFEDMDLS